MADTEATPKPTEAPDEGIQEGFVLTGIDGLDEMLGHPETCPHGNPIPPGECCDHKKGTDG